jgi:hypothetical protein
VQNLESLAAVNKIGGWLKVLIKIFIKTFNICQESNLTEGPTKYVPLVREDRLDSSCITFRQIPSASSSKPPCYIPMPRRALAPISGNIPYRKELTLYDRGVVIGYGLAGATAPQIAIALNLSKSTVRDTLRNAP